MTAKCARALAAQPLWTWADRPRTWIILTGTQLDDATCVLICHRIYWSDWT